MLDRSIFILGIIGAWIVSGTGYIVLKRRMGDRLPNGSIVTEIQDDTEDQNPPGTRWSRVGVSFAMTTNMLILIFAVFLNIIDLWDQVAPFIAIEFPTVVNWIGLFGIWFYYLWGTATMLYNVNYIPLWQSMGRKYVLATGGPYRIIRHPMYVAKTFWLAFLVFLTTGTWLTIIGAVGWIALPHQVKAEEKLLQKRFGNNYTAYAAKTGRFFPKILKNGRKTSY
ncbi:MAG: methyltransferase family protein [Candidatus Hermodarchaeota archaeon]